MNNNRVPINTTMRFRHENSKNQLDISDAYRLHYKFTAYYAVDCERKLSKAALT